MTFLFMNPKGVNFTRGCFITLSNRYSQKGLIFLENGKTGFFSFVRIGEAVSMMKVDYQFHIETGWLTVLN